MYTRRVAAAARAAAAPLGREPVGPARAARHRAARSRPIDPVEMAVDPARRARQSTTRLARAGVAPDRSRSIVIHVSAGNPFRRWPVEHFVELDRGAGRATTRGAASSSRRDRRKRDAAGTRDRRARGPRSAGDAAAARPVVRRVLAGRAARAARSRRALHRRRQRPAAHRRDDRGADRRLVRADAAGAVGAVAQRPATPTESVEVGGLAVPAVRSARLRARRFPLPDADQPEQVIEAAERVAARRPVRDARVRLRPRHG